MVREAALFAAAGYFLLGLSEFALDLVWIKVKLSEIGKSGGLSKGGDLPLPASRPVPPTAPLAVFIPAWRESGVIGAMLRNSLKTLRYGNYRLYVGCYPNDPETIAAVESVGDDRVRLVVGTKPGGTTKADCLNTLWRALCQDEQRQGWRFAAIILHDAEDVVHPDSFSHFGRLIDRYDMIQLPVMPLIDPQSRWIAGHYADEFAEAHLKDMAVRAHIGAAIPSAGVGCAFARHALAALNDPDRGGPVDAESLTEDYELGLKIGRNGRGCFLRTRDAEGSLVATAEYFPSTIASSGRQKSRWIAGIALAGWDRLGWRGGLAERWMRLRDRQVLFAALVTMVGIGAALAWVALELGGPQGAGALDAMPIRILLLANLFFCLWRLTLRFTCTAWTYGWREGLRALPRMGVSTFFLLAAVLRAVPLYVRMRRSGIVKWVKTDHAFPIHPARD